MTLRKRIFINGASGFIGSHLLARCLENDFDVGAIVRKNSNTWRIKDLIDDVSCFDADITEREKLIESIIEFKPDIVVHLATYYAIEHDPNDISRMIDANVTGTMNMLEAAKQANSGMFINTSSCSVYANSNCKIDEKSELMPLNLYALTKIQAEQACSFYSGKFGLNCITLRLFPPYGPADNDRRLIPSVIKSCINETQMPLTTGKQKWDFTYVDDIVDAFISVIAHDNRFDSHEIFNIGADNPVSIRDFVEKVSEILHCDDVLLWGSIPHRINELWYIHADIKKAQKVLDWNPATNIEEGLSKTIEWYEKKFKRDHNEEK